ncbi:MAG TPA: ribosome maturation factor RimP [Firmicutes bacterium]|jgi:ribosome maturation factor RimP|nr:ribosome maturation factor RimP [Bacillota bacterium]
MPWEKGHNCPIKGAIESVSRINIVTLVSQWVEEIIQGSDLELVDVEYVKEHSTWVLRVYLDKPDGIDLEDCQRVSQALDLKLDAEDPIPGAYSLEVSSPGLERPLKKASDYQRFKGRLVKIRTYSGLHGRKRFEGILEGLRDENVVLKWEGDTIEIPLELVAKANLAMDL